MIAFIQNYYGERCIFLAFDDGTHAIHHGLSMWSVFAADGRLVEQFDAFSEPADTEARRKILGYSSNYAGKMGRVEV